MISFEARRSTRTGKGSGGGAGDVEEGGVVFPFPIRGTLPSGPSPENPIPKKKLAHGRLRFLP